MSIYEEYWDYHNTFTNKYGRNTIVLMQIGSFYETYATEHRGPDLAEVSNLINVMCTRKNTSKPVDDKNPYLLGFNCTGMHKFVSILVNNKYTVIIVDQITAPPKPKRGVTNIFSASTYIESITCATPKYMMVLYIECNNQITSIGMCAIDVSVGTVIWYEIHGNDKIVGEELNQFYYLYKPVEFIVYQINTASIILPYCDVTTIHTTIAPDYTKLGFQNKALKKVYPQSGLDSAIEYLHLAMYPYATIAITTAFDYIYQHNPVLVSELKYPTHFDKHKYMILGNNAQEQLDLIGLQKIINQCCTTMGKRMVHVQLYAPYIDQRKIQYYYDETEYMLKQNMYVTIRSYLKGVASLDKLFRKLVMKTIQPYDLYSIYVSLQNISQIMAIYTKYTFTPTSIAECTEYINQYFIPEVLKEGTYKTTFYPIGIHTDIDELAQQLTNQYEAILTICERLNKKYPNSNLTVKQDKQDDYYLYTSKLKGEKLEIELKGDNRYFFKMLKNNCKIFCTELKDNDVEYTTLLKQYFVEDAFTWYQTYKHVLAEILTFVTDVDFICNNAFVANKYHYIKPTIILSPHQSSIVATNLRHPIIERDVEYEYVPHNVSLGDPIKGNLVYGFNSCGKSSYMKAIGLAVIMAQAGFYVSADTFEYGLYKSVYTRITTNDDIYKRKSSFQVEMGELRNILKHANEHSLVIGDEICRGTEYLSANAIFASTILRLLDMQSTFLFASHLHELPKIKEIQDVSHKLRFYHLQVEQKPDKLVFNRQLHEGSGEEVYGITVAKYILDDALFINKATEIKNNILEQDGLNTKLMGMKRSRYNKNVYMDKCIVCNKKEQLESHHIHMQKDFVDGLLPSKRTLGKDDVANIAVLCTHCHDKLHSGEFTITGLTLSSNGVSIV